VYVKLIIEAGAIVAGRGGNGGNGGYIKYNAGTSYYYDGSDGLDGGNCIFTDYAIDVTNNGTISGGAGGGSGGGAVYRLGLASTFIESGGAGGGGFPYGSGGSGGVSTSYVGMTNGNFDGQLGQDADNLTYGDGGLGGTRVTGFRGGDGGNGGDIGQNGLSGDGGSDAGQTGNTVAGTAGVLGDAIHGNSFITWTATGTIYGAII
jgi:hypothetical protein